MSLRVTNSASAIAPKTSTVTAGGVVISPAGGSTGDVLILTSPTTAEFGPPSGGSAIEVLDEGVSLTAALTSLDFVGAGVVATAAGDAVTVTIPSTGIQLASITAASSAIAATEAVVVSASLPAGSIVAGNSYRITGAGVGTTGVTPGTDTFRIRIGPTTLTGTIPTSVTALGIAVVTAQPFRFEAIITLRTSGGSGTIIGECVVEADNVATGRYAVLNSLSTTVASVAVDTTVANLMQLTFQSGNAGSSNTFHVASIEQLTIGPGVGGGLTPSNCKAYNTTTQASVATGTALTFDAEEYDTSAYHDNSTNPTRLTIPATGAYEFSGGTFMNSASGGGPLSFRKNGTTMIRGGAQTIPNAAAYVQVSGSAQLTTGDYIELIYGGASTITVGNATFLDAESWICINRVG